jgi:three-Cys-motif partner protein
MSEESRKVSPQDRLFEWSPLPGQERPEAEIAVKVADFPVWTNNKAKFIRAYLHYFVLLTKHGTYIDGFAGPQEECESDAWSAKLVLESEPQWIKHFHLCDATKAQISRLEELKNVQPIRDSKGKKLYRKIHIYQGDFNAQVDWILAEANISQKQATFCLLDQRTFECHWATVEKLARYKKAGHNKIELFYFLATGWLERAIAALKDTDILSKWWGQNDWPRVGDMSREERLNAIIQRMKKDLGYKSVKAWPIYEKDTGGAIMYHMIHATDHPEAPKFMSRAYRRAVFPLEPIEQLKLELFGDNKGPNPEPGPEPLETTKSA